MPQNFPFFLSSPLMLGLALIVTAMAWTLIAARRAALPILSRWLCAMGMLCLCLAVGGMGWQRPSPGEVAVMVDLSPSTRTADFRTRSHLEKRIHTLLGTIPYRVHYFASTIQDFSPPGEILPDIPCEQTVFQPLAGSVAVVLFSDARFAPPSSAPPIYPVLDPNLESPVDAAVSSLQVRGREIVVNTSNSGTPRRLTLEGAANASADTVPTGAFTRVRPLDPHASNLSARLAPGDAWPENDQLVALPSATEQSERWWVGASPPANGWRGFSPARLPTLTSAYLNVSTVVLENIRATELPALAQQRLRQYVRDLGGGLVILGGDHAFAAGAYPGSELENLSPLTSTPPQPTTHWILLADGSGSMAEVQAGLSLWHRATDAILSLTPHLPPDDLLTIGSFSDTLSLWTTGKTVRQTAGTPLPPPNIGPHGPTNLEDTLLGIARNAEGVMPTQLLLLTDAEAQIADPAGLQLLLKQKKIRLHLLAIAEGSALPVLRSVIAATGGTVVKQFDPQKWSDSIQALMQAAMLRLLGRDALPVHFTGELSGLPPRDVFPWNRTWLKPSATLLGEGLEDSRPLPAAARWNVGEGRVLALPFDAGPGAGETLSSAVERTPRDPRYHITWETDAHLKVSVDALDGGRYLNGKRMELRLSEAVDASAASTIIPIPQTAPGNYTLECPAPRAPIFAGVWVDGHVIERIAVAGRYAPEFDAIGNDHEAIQKIARQTGGQVIPPRQIWPIDFHWPIRSMPLDSYLGTAGAALILLGLLRWKRVA